MSGDTSNAGYLSYELNDGVTVLLRLAPIAKAENDLVGFRSRVTAATESLDEAIGALTDVINSVAHTVRSKINHPGSVEFVFHASFESKASIKLFEVGAESGVEVHLTWENESQN